MTIFLDLRGLPRQAFFQKLPCLAACRSLFQHRDDVAIETDALILCFRPNTRVQAARHPQQNAAAGKFFFDLRFWNGNSLIKPILNQ